MSDFRRLTLPTKHDVRGQLVILEHHLPFEPRRIFWITGADGRTRGGHRHHVTRLALVAAAGRVHVHVDDGAHVEDVLLADPATCLLVEPDDWHTMTFEDGAVLLVFASHDYDAADYITAGYRGEAHP